MLGLFLKKVLIFLCLYLFVDHGHRGIDINRRCLTGSGVDSWLSEVSLGTPVDGVQGTGGLPASRQSAVFRDGKHPWWVGWTNPREEWAIPGAEG